MRDLLVELLEIIDDVVDDMGCREELNGLRWILENGSGADRQKAVFERTGDLKAVVDFMMDETEYGLFPQPQSKEATAQ